MVAVFIVHCFCSLISIGILQIFMSSSDHHYHLVAIVAVHSFVERDFPSTGTSI